VGPAATDLGAVALVGFVVTSACAPAVLTVLRQRRIIDVPSSRSSHLLPTPRGGGLACVLGFACAVALAPHLAPGSELLLVAAGTVMAALGLIDDVHSLSMRVRLTVQGAMAAVASGWALGVLGSPTAGLCLLALGGGIWIVSYVNAFNFMDGINGLAGAAAVVAGLSFAFTGLRHDDMVLATGGAAVASTAAAFLPWNFPRALFFLGDVGSYLFGASIAVLVLVGLHAHLPVEALIAPEALFIADTGWTLARRIARGDDWLSAHRSHVYQRLHQGGWSHTATTLTGAALMVTISLLGLLSETGLLWARMTGDTLAAILVVGYLRSPRLLLRGFELPRLRAGR
jgi:UDP-GlcNAc:undecaprenyl-phosphate GlcNAc-1-phosphate transferase